MKKILFFLFVLQSIGLLAQNEYTVQSNGKLETKYLATKVKTLGTGFSVTGTTLNCTVPSLPPATSANQIPVSDGAGTTYVATDYVPVPVGTTPGQTLTWNGTTWVAGLPQVANVNQTGIVSVGSQGFAGPKAIKVNSSSTNTNALTLFNAGTGTSTGVGLDFRVKTDSSLFASVIGGVDANDNPILSTSIRNSATATLVGAESFNGGTYKHQSLFRETRPLLLLTAPYTMTANDLRGSGKYLLTGTGVLQLPDITTLNLQGGDELIFMVSSGSVTITPHASDTINGGTAGTGITITPTDGAVKFYVSSGTSYHTN